MKLPAGFPREIEAIASDLDRTLIADDGVLRPRTRAAIAAARGAGLRFVVATGRMFRSTRPYLLEAEIAEPVICYQGAVVAEPEDGRFLRHEPVPLELAREAIQAVEHEGFPVEAFLDDELFVGRDTRETDRYSESRNVAAHVVGDLASWLPAPPTKLVALGDPEPLDGLSSRLKASFDGRLAVAKSLPWLVEISSPGATKGVALEFLAEHLGFSLERTIAFGDGENDVELFRRAAYSVAVGDGDPRLITHADAICPPAAEEGVAAVIEAYLHSVG